MQSTEKLSTWPKCSARKVSSRQPGTITANSPAALGADHSGSRNGPVKLRLPRVITCPLRVSLTGLAIGIVDRAELGFLRRRGGVRRRAGKARGTAARRHRVERTGLAGRLLGVRGAHGTQVVGRLQPAKPGELVGLVEHLARSD